MNVHAVLRQRLSLAATVLAVAALAACGTGSTPGGSTGAGGSNSPVSPPTSGKLPADSATGATGVAVDHCSLLAAAEVEAALGRKVVSAGKDPSGQSKCLWTLEPAPEHRTMGVTAYLDDSSAAANFAFDTRDSTPIPGLGDAAAYEIRTGGAYVLNVLRGNDRVRLQASFGARPDETNFAAFEALASQVLARL